MKKPFFAIIGILAVASIIAYYFYLQNHRFYIISTANGIAYEIDRRTGQSWLLSGNKKIPQEDPLLPNKKTPINADKDKVVEKWGFNPSTVGAIGTVVAAAGFVAGLIGLVLTYKQNKRARNLDAFIAISIDMRRRWENEWASILREQVPRLNLKERHSGEVGLKLTYMLNWLDWMGLIVKMKLIDKELLFGSLYSVIKEILKASAHQLQSDIDDPERGRCWWGNLLYIAEQPEIAIDIAKEAESLRKKWASPKEQ